MWPPALKPRVLKLQGFGPRGNRGNDRLESLNPRSGWFLFRQRVGLHCGSCLWRRLGCDCPMPAWVWAELSFITFHLRSCESELGAVPVQTERVISRAAWRWQPAKERHYPLKCGNLWRHEFLNHQHPLTAGPKMSPMLALLVRSWGFSNTVRPLARPLP